MSTNEDHDESFIILGCSPRPSMDGDLSNGYVSRNDADKESLVMSNEGRAALQACLSQGDSPSPASLMVASTIVTDNSSTQDLQMKFGELLDENTLLKETLKQNNDSMKEQFLMIASCQEDMLNTHKMHKEKFDETRDLVERLRQENKKLKTDIANLLDSNAPTPIDIQSERLPSLSLSLKEKTANSGPRSTIEFVTSPDDEIVDKLTLQLGLVEKQRRQVIMENDNLVWQKESLERVVDALTKERDQLRDQMQIMKMQSELKHVTEIDELKKKIQILEKKLISVDEEVRKRDVAEQQFDVKVATLQHELKNAQLRVLEAENIKLEMSKLKISFAESSKMHKDQLQELQNRLRESQTVVFQPLRVSLNTESNIDIDHQSIIAQYDQGLKKLSELMTTLVNSTTENLVATSSVISDVLSTKLDGKPDDVLQPLNCIKKNIDKQHQSSLTYLIQIKEIVLVLEKVLKDLCASFNSDSVSSDAVQNLTQALLGRADELESAKQEIAELKNKFQTQGKDDIELLKAQLEVYKTDFLDEREARQKMASEKEDIVQELRHTQKANKELVEQLEEVKKLNPNIYKTATTKKSKPKTLIRKSTSTDGSSTADATGNSIYVCPKCNSFSTTYFQALEDHFDYCLDDF